MLRNQLINAYNKHGRLCSLQYNQIRTSFYNKYRHGPKAITNPPVDHRKNLQEFLSKKGWEYVKNEIRRTIKKASTHPTPKPIEPYETRIFEHFDSEESIKKWKVWADSDSENGFSSATFVRSPSGHALFKGILDTRCPEDGETSYSGFACIIGPHAPKHKLAQMETFWDWSRFNIFEMRFRGDGRKYNVALNTGTYTSDLQYYDMHGYPVYSRGGPYWETVRIPFSKFIFTAKGKIQDVQMPLDDADIKCVCITITDRVDGPFAFEIDYMGLRYEPPTVEESTAYEHYVAPHIKWKTISVDHGPPE